MGIALSRRRFLLSASVLTGSALLSACAGATAPAGEKPAEEATAAPAEATAAPVTAGEAVTVTYWQYMTDMEEIETPILEAFNEANPGIKTEWQWIPWQQYWEKLNATLAAGNPPDVWNTAPTFYFEYILRKQLTDVTEFFKETIKPEEFFTTALSGYDLEEKYYGIPRNIVTTVCFFNKTLFDEAGIEPPPLDGDWTWDDYLEKAQGIVEYHNEGDKTTTWGASTIQGVGWLNIFMKGNGCDPFKGTFRRDLLDAECDYTQESCAGTIGYMAGLINEYKVAPPAGEFEGLGDALLTGRLAMNWSLNWGVNTYKDAPFEWNLTQVPKGMALPLTYGGADGLVLSQASKAKDESWKLILWLIDPKTGGDFLTSSGAMPVLKDQAVLDEYLGRHPDKNLQAFLDAAEVADNYFCLGYSEFNKAVDDELANVFLGNMATEEGCTKATTAGNEAIQRIYQQYQEAVGG